MARLNRYTENMKQDDQSQPAMARSAIPPVRRGLGLHQFLEASPPAVILTASLLLTALVTVVDILSGPDITFAFFYLVPIAVAAWYGTRWMGVAVAVLSGFAWVANEIIDLAHGKQLYFYWNAGARVALYLVVAFLMSKLRRQLREASILARTDPLTGLFNRRHLYERIKGELQRASRYVKPLTLISIDIDDFKAINDRHGHAIGDAVLCGIGQVLQSNTRQTDVPARIGGDEFAVLLVETGADDGSEAAEKLQQALRTRMAELGKTVTVSIGSVTFTSPPRDVDQLFRVVDEQLYKAKSQGKNRIVRIVADPEALSGNIPGPQASE